MLIARVSATVTAALLSRSSPFTHACVSTIDSLNCLLTCFSAELSCFYFTAWLDDHYIRQLPDPDELTRELLDSSDSALSFTQYVETNNGTIVTGSSIFTLHLTSFVRDSDATDFFAAIRQAFVAELGA